MLYGMMLLVQGQIVSRLSGMVSRDHAEIAAGMLNEYRGQLGTLVATDPGEWVVFSYKPS